MPLEGVASGEAGAEAFEVADALMGHTFLKDSAGKSPSMTEYGAFCALGNEGLELGFPHGMPPTNAEQITLNGMIPVGQAGLVILQAHKQSGTTDTLRFKFSAPAFNAGVKYATNFCVGPATNPCGLPTSYVVVVPGGEERLAVLPASYKP